jgi:midasin
VCHVDAFEKVNSLVSNQLGGLNLAGGLSDGVLHRFSLRCILITEYHIFSYGNGCFILFLYRDLLKWCKRILGIDIDFEGFGFASSGFKLIYHEVFLRLSTSIITFVTMNDTCTSTAMAAVSFFP